MGIRDWIAVIIFGVIIIVMYVLKNGGGLFRFSQKQNKVQILPKKKVSGVVFGKYGTKLACSLETEEGHIAVLGGSGLGKTSALLIPTLRAWKGRAFVIDISGDICKNARMPGCLIYQPQNPKTIPYNIFGAIDSQKDRNEKYELLEQLAFLIMPDKKKNTSEAAEFFNTEGRKMLTSALICYYNAGMDFISICEKIMENNWRDLLNDIAGHKNKKANLYIASFAGASEQNNAGCKQSMDKAIKLFATNEKIKKTIRRPVSGEKCVTPEILEKKNVFIVIDDDKLKLYAPLLHIITAQSLEYFSKRPVENKTTILFCLDEFVSLGEMEITEALRKLRKKHIRIMMLTQSMADIDLLYGRDERMAMMNNYLYKVILGCDDTDTQEYFAKLIGQHETKKNSISKNSSQTTHTEAEAKDWIIQPSDLARLGNEVILLSPDGCMGLKKNFYYKN